ncbi:hypothetical protein ACW7EJ_04845, partial [Acinetobacter soli]
LEVNTFRGSFKSLPQQANKQAYFAPENVIASPDVDDSRLVMEYISASFKAGEGPKIISQTFYVRVKAGTDPNPGTEDPSGDFY